MAGEQKSLLDSIASELTNLNFKVTYFVGAFKNANFKKHDVF